MAAESPLDLDALRKQFTCYLYHAQSFPDALGNTAFADAIGFADQVRRAIAMAAERQFPIELRLPLVKLLQPSTELAAILPMAVQTLDLLLSCEPASADSIQAASAKRKTPHTRHKKERDIKWAEEYALGLEDGEWNNISEFASTKRIARSTMSKILDRGGKAKKARESVNRSR